MTVRVIGKATTQRVTCPECLSILEFEREDRYYIHQPMMDLSQQIAVPVIKCAGCGWELELPKLVVTDATWRSTVD